MTGNPRRQLVGLAVVAAVMVTTMLPARAQANFAAEPVPGVAQAPGDASASATAAASAAARAPAPGFAAKAAIPYKPETDSTGSLAARAVGVLVLAGLAAYGGAVALKRAGFSAVTRSGKTRRVRLAESVRLSRRSVLHVVEYGGEQLLLAENEQGIVLLSSRASGAIDG